MSSRSFIVHPLSAAIGHTRTIATLTLVSCAGTFMATAMAAPDQSESGTEDQALPTITIKASRDTQDSYTVKASAAATRLNLTLKETPQSISVITSQQIADQNLTDVSKVLDQTPGIYRQSYGSTAAWGTGGEYTSYYSRGFKVINYQIDGVMSSPSIDGRSYTSISNADTSIFDNVTIIKGAAGLLNGSGYPSASIQFNRKHATADTQSSVKVSVGSWNNYRSEFDVSSSLNSDETIRGRMVAAYQQGDSWQHWGNSSQALIYGIVDADLDEATTLSLGTLLSRNKTDGLSIHSFANIDDLGNLSIMGRTDNSAPRWAYTHTDTINAFAQLQHEFTNRWKLNANYNFTRADTESIYGVVGSNSSTTNYQTGLTSVTAGYQHATPTEHSVDLALTGPYQLFGREHELMFGGSYQDINQNDPNYARKTGAAQSVNLNSWDGDTAILTGLYTASGHAILKFRQSGAYVATRLNPLDSLHVLLGGRLSSVDYYSESGNVNTATSIQQDHQFTPYAGLVYDFTPEWSAYGSYTSIFLAQSSKDYQMNVLDPKQGDNYELGIKGELMDQRLNVNAAIFQSKLDNEAIEAGEYKTDDEVPGAKANDAYYRAAQGVKTSGFELGAGGEILAGWNLSGGYTYQQSKERGNKVNTDQPQRLLKVFSTYRLSGTLEKLTIGGGINWQSKIYNDYDTGTARQANMQKDFTLINLMAKYQLTPDTTLGLNLDNLTDEQYRINTSNQTYGAPRSITGSITFKY